MPWHQPCGVECHVPSLVLCGMCDGHMFLARGKTCTKRTPCAICEVEQGDSWSKRNKQMSDSRSYYAAKRERELSGFGDLSNKFKKPSSVKSTSKITESGKSDMTNEPSDVDDYASLIDNIVDSLPCAQRPKTPVETPEKATPKKTRRSSRTSSSSKSSAKKVSALSKLEEVYAAAGDHAGDDDVVIQAFSPAPKSTKLKKLANLACSTVSKKKAKTAVTSVVVTPITSSALATSASSKMASSETKDTSGMFCNESQAL